MEQKQTCYRCPYCKAWYDKENYTVRLSCTNTKRKRGKTITWKCYPLYNMKDGLLIQTEDTIESISKELLERVKNKLSPKWCKFRIEKEQKKSEEK